MPGPTVAYEDTEYEDAVKWKGVGHGNAVSP